MKAQISARQILAVGRESWLLFIAVSIANASNYIFHVLVSRELGPHDYGALGSILAILLFLSVPLGAIQTVVAKRVAERDTEGGAAGDHSWQAYVKSALPMALVASLIVALLSPAIVAFLKLGSWTAALMIAVYVTPAVLLAVVRGCVQGRLQFGRLAFLSVAPVAVRLAVGVIAVRLGAGVPGAVAATVLADAVGVLIGFALLGSRGSWSVAGKPWAFLRAVGPVAAELGAVWFFIELDLILVRHYLAPGEAGAYAAAGLLARAVLFVPGAVCLVALPHFAKTKGRGARAHRWLFSSSSIVIGGGALAALVLSVGASVVVKLTFGDSFAGAESVLAPLAIAMVALGLCNLLVFFHIAAGSRTYQTILVAAGLEILAVHMWHGSPRTVAFVVLALSFSLAAVLGLAARSIARSPSRQPTMPPEVHVYPESVPATLRPELTLIVPCHNGGPELARNVRNFVDVLESFDRTYEVIVVSDGSTDGCDVEVARAAHDSLRLVHYTTRQGKGTALRVGMIHARGEYVAFIDADGELDPGDLGSFLSLMDVYDPDIVVGSKRHPLSKVEYPATRRIMSKTYQLVIRLLFGLNVRDTQTGMKMIRRDVLDAVLPRMLEKRFAFDLEFLVVARRLGYSRVFEAPVTLRFKFDSSVSPKQVFWILRDTAAIYYRRYWVRHYDYEFPLLRTVEGSEPYQTVSLSPNAQQTV